MNEQELPAATTLGEIDLHLRYMRRELSAVAAALSGMATKADITELSRKFDSYATHEDVRSLRSDLDEIRQQVDTGSVTNNFKRWAEWAQRISAIVALLTVGVVAVAYLVRLYDRSPSDLVKIFPK